ncbi:MAG: hypothetical protein EPO13_02195 [Actinomycetota bacterium]|nr:MAG: hypothetical protein EPO13_02195 [Actinomycetota bacterium]
MADDHSSVHSHHSPPAGGQPGNASAAVPEPGSQPVPIVLPRQHGVLVAGLVAVWGIAAVLVDLTSAGPVLRLPVVAAFALLGPGIAVATALGLRGPVAVVAALMVGPSFLIVASLVVLYAGVWSPQWVLDACVVVVLIAAEVTRRTDRANRRRIREGLPAQSLTAVFARYGHRQLQPGEQR